MHGKLPLVIALLLTFLPVTPVLAGPLPPVTETDGRMGTCFSYYDTTWNRLAAEAGSRWDRFDFRWDVIEAQRGTFTFGPHDSVVAQDRTYGLNIVGILWATPTWAGEPISGVQKTSPAVLPPGYPARSLQNAGDPATAVPRNLNLAWDNPENYWGQYVYKVVSHYKELGVHTWEVWNEPDMPGYWNGTSQNYTRLLQVAYLAAKAADPQATILFGGQAYWFNPGFHVAVLDQLKNAPGAAAYNYYFDVMSLHLYSTAESLYEIPAQMRQTITDRVGYHPLWLTEAGVPLWGENGRLPYLWSATPAEAAAFTLESYALARAAGVERYFFFRMHDDAAGMGEFFGLSRDDHSLRPAYTAYQLAARYLRHENQITGPFRSTTGRVTYWGTPYGRVTLIWNRITSTVAYTHSAVMPTVTVINLDGQAEVRAAPQGQLPLTLAPATANNGAGNAIIIGGPPLLLLEIDTELPTSTLSVPLAPVTSSTVSVSWQVTDTLSGYWYEEIQMAAGPAGPWTAWAGYPQTLATATFTGTLPGSGPWYFRARARDKTGNWENWPATPDGIIYPVSNRQVALQAAVYGDLNLNGQRDAQEPELPDAIHHWFDINRHQIAELNGATVHFTATTTTGNNFLRVEAPGYLFADAPFTVTYGTGIQETSLEIGLHPIHTRLLLPLIFKK